MKHKIIILVTSIAVLGGLAAFAIVHFNKKNSVAEAPTKKESVDTSSFTKISTKDLDTDYSETADVIIDLEGDSATCNSSLVEVDGGTITITDEGTYIVRGTLNDGQILVDADKDDDVHIILKDAIISNTTGSAIYVEKADKVIITLADDSANTLSDSTYYESASDSDEEDTPASAIYAKCDLTINGNGSLTINANNNNAIQSKDDLKIVGGSITINAVNNGIKGKDSITIDAATINITCGGNGIVTTNSEDTDKGYINITGGSITINSTGDGIQSTNTVYIADGVLDITTGGGSSNGPTHSDGGFGWKESTDTSSDDVSDKGIKSATDIQIDGGTITINSANDSIHSGNVVTINGGTLSLASGDDGIHADYALYIEDGNIEISTSYEGLEALIITLDGGYTSVVASDDGLNAANINSSGESMQADNACKLIMNDGVLIVNADGDGVDSNGAIEINGGVMLVSGPTNSANAAVDYGGSLTINGGYLFAAGSSGMAENITAGTQCGALVTMDTVSAGSTITIADADGNVIISYTFAKTFNAINVSTPDMATGNTYTVYEGGTVSGGTELCTGCVTGGTISGGNELTSYEQSSTVSSSGSAGGMGGHGGGMNGGGMNGGGMGGHGGR